MLIGVELCSAYKIRDKTITVFALHNVMCQAIEAIWLTFSTIGMLMISLRKLFYNIKNKLLLCKAISIHLQTIEPLNISIRKTALLLNNTETLIEVYLDVSLSFITATEKTIINLLSIDVSIIKHFLVTDSKGIEIKILLVYYSH